MLDLWFAMVFQICGLQWFSQWYMSSLGVIYIEKLYDKKRTQQLQL